MSCDIHLQMEVLRFGRWEPVEEDVEIAFQNYTMFAILANVRNYSNIKPLFERRGVPKEASNKYLNMVDEWAGDGHSHSWVRLYDLKRLLGQNVSADTELGTYRDHCKGICEWEKSMEQMINSWEFEETAEDIRICFFFDN